MSVPLSLFSLSENWGSEKLRNTHSHTASKHQSWGYSETFLSSESGCFSTHPCPSNWNTLWLLCQMEPSRKQRVVVCFHIDFNFKLFFLSNNCFSDNERNLYSVLTLKSRAPSKTLHCLCSRWSPWAREGHTGHLVHSPASSQDSSLFQVTETQLWWLISQVNLARW